MTQSAEQQSSTQGGLFKRILITLVIFVFIGALALLLPPSIPGELSTSQMTAHGAGICQSCPPTEQLTYAGLMAGSTAWYANAAFAAPPLDSRVQISFAGVPGSLQLEQTGTKWTTTGISPAAMPALLNTMQQNNQVVFVFANTLRTNGFAVSTGSGDRIPATGFMVPVYPQAAHFNGTDVVLLLILAATAWYGYKRGLLREVSDLIAVLVSLGIAVLVYHPLAGWCAHTFSHPRMAAAAVSGSLMLVTTSLWFYFMPKITARLDTATSTMGRGTSGVVGGAVGCLRQLSLLAMLLAIGMDLTVFHWASNSIQTSLLGAPLLHAWQTMFSGS